MKISWGTKIAALYIGFVVMIVTLVSATFFHRSELVADNYYEQETTFQQRLDATAAATALNEPLRISEEGGDVVIRFPAAFSLLPISATSRFYAAADAGADRNFTAQLSNGSQWRIPRSGLGSAHYEVQVGWVAEGKSYYQSMPLYLR